MPRFDAYPSEDTPAQQARAAAWWRAFYRGHRDQGAAQFAAFCVPFAKEAKRWHGEMHRFGESLLAGVGVALRKIDTAARDDA